MYLGYTEVTDSISVKLRSEWKLKLGLNLLVLGTGNRGEKNRHL